MLRYARVPPAVTRVRVRRTRPTLEPPGGRRVKDYGGVIGYGLDRPDFWTGPARAGDGFRESHLVFTATDRAAVDAFFAAAVARGAEVLHEPRTWPECRATYHGASSTTLTATTSKQRRTSSPTSRYALYRC